jgi:hypothetical protein
VIGFETHEEAWRHLFTITLRDGTLLESELRNAPFLSCLLLMTS